MRVTSSMLVSNFMNNLNTNMARLDKLQTQMATNRKFAHLSDDPVGVIYSQQARYRLNRLQHYQKNVESAEGWLTQAETTLSDLNELVKSAYEACIDVSTDVKSPSDKKNASEYLGQLRDQLLQTLNSTFGDKFVFGGYNTTGYVDGGKTVTPFTLEAVPVTVQKRNELGDYMWLSQPDPNDPSTWVPDTEVVSREVLHYNNVDLTDPANAGVIQTLREDVLHFSVGIGVDMPVTLNGIDVVFYGTDEVTGEPKNIFSLLDDLYRSANNGYSPEHISVHIPELQEAQSHLLAYTAELGGRANRLEILSSRYEQDELNYTQMKSDAEDADAAEVIMNFKMAESVYKAALATGSYIIQPTLMDFLR